MPAAEHDVPWVIFDIDGTVADCRHRQGHLDKVVPDWEAFFAASGSDAPLSAGVALAMVHRLDAELLWLTGRPERYRNLTVQWLRDQGLPTAHLWMRPDDDMRPAAVFKAECVGRIAAKRHVRLIVDDDDHVVAALRDAGWPVEHAKWVPR